MIAHPKDCPTHHFHSQCLVKHAKRNRECPIDQIPFESIVCDNGLPIFFKSSQPRRVTEAPVSKVESNRTTIPDASPSASAEGSLQNNSVESTTSLPSKSFENANDAPCFSSPPPSDNCAICFQPNCEPRASLDSCTHWFHEHCTKEYFLRHSLCPVKGCYKEAKSFITSMGNHAQIVLHVEAEYRNMVSAPLDFQCVACGGTNINVFRACARPCGHICHRQCLIEFVRKERKCPSCFEPTSVVQCDVEGTLRFP